MLSISVLLLVRHRRKNAIDAGLAENGLPPPHLLKRDEQGEIVTLIPGLREREKEVYRNFTRMLSSVFDDT